MPTAFDGIRTPSADVIADCVHCGFCLPTCPTYSLWDEEMDSPRGRIVLMKAGLEEGSDLSRTVVTHIDRCLGCMACVTACPSGVRYDELIEDTRSQIERNFARTPWERLVRRGIFAAFPHPDRMRALAPLIAAGRAVGLARAARRRRGGLQLHAGDDGPARELARRTIEAFDDCDLVAVNAAGCGSAMKDYGHLLRDDPEWADRAAAFSQRVRDVSELLAAAPPTAPRHPVRMRVAYHDACHLAHAQAVRSEPRDLLRGIPELELVEPAGWERCF